MSPRAAWRLEGAGFGAVYDYAAGKSDWLAADLPFEGTAQLAGEFTRRQAATATAAAVMRPGVSTVRPSEQAGDLVHRMRQAGVTRIAVIRSDGTQAGLFFAGDAPAG